MVRVKIRGKGKAKDKVRNAWVSVRRVKEKIKERLTVKRVRVRIVRKVRIRSKEWPNVKFRNMSEKR